MRHRVPYIPQMEMAECGAAALASVLAYWGHHAPLSQVREACKVTRDGANAASLLQAAHKYGLEAQAVKVEVEHLRDLPLPAILHWEFKHFVVLERITAKGVTIVDPAMGRRFISRAEFGTAFTGVALVFAPDDDFFERKRGFPSLGRYMEILQSVRPSLVQLLGASFMLQAVGMLFPVASQILVDQVLLPRNQPWLWGLAAGLILALAAKLLLGLLRSYVLQGLQNRMDKQLLEGFTTHLISLPLTFFFQRQAGDLMQRLESNSQIRDLFSSRSVSAILDVLLLLGYATLMLAYHWQLGFLVMGLSALRVVLLLSIRRHNQQLMITELTVAGQESAILTEALGSLETIKASAAEDRVLARWIPRLVRRSNVSMERQGLAITSTQLMGVLQGLASAALFWVGGREVLGERMTLGVFTAFLSLQGLFMGPLESMLAAITDLQFLSSHLLRLDDVMESAPEVSGNIDPGRLKGHIDLQGVSFQYAEGSPWILQDIRLSLSPGEKVALVGRTGAGKSTLARLLMGMHLPTKGTIRFDQQDLRTLDLQKLRGQMGVVMQESFLLDDTVRTNVALRDPHLSLERVQWAAEVAQVHSVIQKLPQGYMTRLGENAQTLSGGERQRLCIARAVALEPSILLLDEATSSLDLETEARVHANLAELGCTRIVIAHRLETVKDADRILVLKEGRIAQQGTYDELYEQPGPFQEAVLAMEAGHG
jgi:ATP-binding cassette, subfamily B, bacterial